MLRLIVLAILMMACAHLTQASGVYKYRDANGKWVFSDKKPKSESFEELAIKTGPKQKEQPQPRVFAFQQDGQRQLMAENPLHAPVSMQVLFGDASRNTELVIGANQSVALGVDPNDSAFRYRWTLGDPGARADDSVYAFPVVQPGRYKITQAFRGSFSHAAQPNLYALDIAIPVGTEIVAAREGTVIWVKDDYHMSGQGSYFLDKANFVLVLHKDGTFASYAHTLMGSAQVEAGQRVETGDVLARSGSSGFSSGPHLHFVIRQNVAGEVVSVPFSMTDPAGQMLPLRAGKTVIVKP